MNVQLISRVVIPPPPKTPPLFRRVCHCMRFFSESRVCVPAFACESERGPFVKEVEKRNKERLGDKIYGGSFAGFFSFADVEGSQRTGKCMYIKAWRNKKISLAAQDSVVAEGGKAPVSACEPLCAIL